MDRVLQGQQSRLADQALRGVRPADELAQALGQDVERGALLPRRVSGAAQGLAMNHIVAPSAHGTNSFWP